MGGEVPDPGPVSYESVRLLQGMSAKYNWGIDGPCCGHPTKSHRSWDRADYNRRIALWITSCRLSHGAVCSCPNWKAHLLTYTDPIEKAAATTQTENNSTGSDRNAPTQETQNVSAYNFDSLMKVITQPAQTPPIKSILKKPTVDDLLYLSPDIRPYFTPQKKKRKRRHLEPDIPPWYSPEMVGDGDDTDSEEDFVADPTTAGIPTGVSPVGRVRFEDDAGQVYESSSARNL